MDLFQKLWPSVEGSLSRVLFLIQTVYELNQHYVPAQLYILVFWLPIYHCLGVCFNCLLTCVYLLSAECPYHTTIPESHGLCHWRTSGVARYTEWLSHNQQTYWRQQQGGYLPLWCCRRWWFPWKQRWQWLNRKGRRTCTWLPALQAEVVVGASRVGRCSPCPDGCQVSLWQFVNGLFLRKSYHSF